ncbi:MAG: NlpC/P60 family protein [Pseudomonadota bacterium]
MSDRRTTPDPRLVDGTRPAQIAVPLADLRAAPDGARDRQLILGDPVTILGATQDHAYLRSEKDGYIGFVAQDALGPPSTATHIVTSLATHAYAAPDIKSPDTATLTFGSRLTALSGTPGFVETALGHVPKQHLGPADWQAQDPVDIARLFLGTPYLWGGNSRLGLDCSGLVQAALLACGQACPGDSDMQQSLGTEVTGEVRRGDLLFWKGHVAMAADAQTLIHANAHAMATVYEDRAAAIARIAQSDGPVIAHRRL